MLATSLLRQLPWPSLFLLSCLLQRRINAEAGGPLTWWELLTRFEELSYDGLGRYKQEGAVSHPLVIEDTSISVRGLEWIASS